MMQSIPTVSGKDKKELIHILLHEEYGYLPREPKSISAALISRDESFCAGKAVLDKILLTCTIDGAEFSFPISYARRACDEKSPCFVHINFRPDIPDRYQPTEELIDSGYNVLSFCYFDVTSDDGDFNNGLAGVIYPNGNRGETECGKIGLWAWAAMRVIDYAMTLPEIDHGRISVVGHSRLGKTALLVGALDERVYCAFSNDSGCSGAALSRGKQGETISKIVSVFPYWFAKSYHKYAGQESTMPFDQHFLIAANVPHRVYVASAVEDLWADPQKEYESCLLAEKYYNEHGLSTFLPEGIPPVGAPVDKGYIGFHIRNGKHYLSREDWLLYIKFLSEQA